MSVTSTRWDQQPIFVLHTYPFKETSLIVEMFGRECGRIAAVAKGARRPRSAMRGMLQSFQPLLATWSGKSELRNLHGMEWGDSLLLLRGEALMCGFYLNELLLRLLPREDPHAQLFTYYAQTLRVLADGGEAVPILRSFELRLLQELGYALPLLQDAEGAAIQAEREYWYVAERGALTVDEGESSVKLRGKTLLDMESGDFSDARTRQQSKQLMRTLLAHYLGDNPLYTRQLLLDLQEL